MRDYLTDSEAREIVKPFRDGGPISRFYATGEIQDDLIPALGWAARDHTTHDRLWDVILYAQEAGDRPSVNGWVAKVIDGV